MKLKEIIKITSLKKFLDFLTVYKNAFFETMMLNDLFNRLTPILIRLLRNLLILHKKKRIILN